MTRKKAKSVKRSTATTIKKQKRNSNPGVRQVGGRIYDSENGTSCHQCRQKTLEIKAKCRKCSLYYCPRCLANRYSESLEKANSSPKWSCPKCRKICNCSNCRKKAGLEATGILAGLAKTAGYKSVAELLKKHPDVPKTVKMAKQITEDSSKSRLCKQKAGVGLKSPFGVAQVVRASVCSTGMDNVKTPPRHRVEKKNSLDQCTIVDDAMLGPRKRTLPQPSPIAIHVTWTNDSGCERHQKEGGKAHQPSSSRFVPSEDRSKRESPTKRHRNSVSSWMRKVQTPLQVPDGVDTGQLVCILEFLATFGESVLHLDVSPVRIAAFAAELLQPATSWPSEVFYPLPRSSAVCELHVLLLHIVRKAWGIQEADEAISKRWQEVMRCYLAETELKTAEIIERRRLHGCPAFAFDDAISVKIERAHGPSGPFGENENNSCSNNQNYGAEHYHREEESECGCRDNADCSSGGETRSESDWNERSRQMTAALPTLSSYPNNRTGYWSLEPGVRVHMLYALVHDALETYTFREAIDEGLQAAEKESKAHKMKLSEDKRALKQLVIKECNQQIALLISKSRKRAMTLQEQRSLVLEARRRVEDASLRRDVGGSSSDRRGASGGDAMPRCTSSVRCVPVGKDRDGSSYFELSTSCLLTGHAQGLVVMSSDGERMEAQRDPGKVCAAMDLKGRCEGSLRRALTRTCSVS